jgi:stage II sporulation protein AA (anti-sigma F factor antagonist)
MEILEQKKDNFTIVVINGRLDTTNYQDLEKKLQQLMDDGASHLILNCVKLDYISSSGLRIFLMFLKKIKAMNGKFVICSLQENIHEIFQISGFTTIFDIHPNCEEAVSSL